jgi:predicted transcriptional regulator
MMSEQDDHLRELVAEVAAAYFSNSHVGAQDIPTVINQIASSLSGVSGQASSAEPTADEPETPKATSAQVKKSITPAALISFEDNRGYKTLKRHLSTRGLTPEQYREKWGLPRDYPMVAPSYSEARSAMAKSLGLGRKPAAASAGRGRKKA